MYFRQQTRANLHKNPGFCYLCGIDHAKEIPTEWAFSRFIKSLTEESETG